MGPLALTLTLLARVSALERDPWVGQLLAASSRSTDFLHSHRYPIVTKDKRHYGEDAPYHRKDSPFERRAPKKHFEDDALSVNPPSSSWQPTPVERIPGLAEDALRDLDLLPELLEVHDVAHADQIKAQTRQNRVRQMVQALKGLQIDALKNQERWKTSARTSRDLVRYTSQALLSVVSSSHKRDPQPEAESDANKTAANTTDGASIDHKALPVPVDDSLYEEGTLHGWIRTVLVVIFVGLFVGGMVVYCFVPLALRIVKPFRPRSEDEAKKFLDDLMSQRSELETQQADLDKEMEELSKEIAEEKEKAQEREESESDSESKKDQEPESREDRETATSIDDASEKLRDARRRSTKRSMKKQRSSVPVLLPDGTYALPETSQESTKSKMEQVAEALNPLLARREEFENNLKQRRAAMYQKSREAIIEEVKDATTAIADALEPRKDERLELTAADVPPVALCIAGLCVPVQLQTLYLTCITNLSIKLILGILSVVALLIDHSTPCWTLSDNLASAIDGSDSVKLVQSSLIYPWMQIDAFSIVLQIVVHVGILSIVNKTVAEVDAIHNDTVNPEGGLEALTAMMDTLLASCGKTMIVYDSIVDSWPFWLLSFVVFFDFGWQIYGLTFFLSTPSTYCDATVMRIVFRIRAFTFLLAALYHFALLVSAAGSLMIRNTRFTDAVVERAHDIDADFSPPWLPICTIIVRAFLVRDQSDLDKMQLKILRAQKRKNDAVRETNVEEEKDLMLKAKCLEENIALLQESVDEANKVHFIEQQRNKVKSMLDKFEHIMRTMQENQIIKDQVDNLAKETHIRKTLREQRQADASV